MLQQCSAKLLPSTEAEQDGEPPSAAPREDRPKLKPARSSSLRRMYASARATSWRSAGPSSTTNAERPSLDDEPIERTGSGQTDKVRWGAHNAPARADADRWAVHVHEDEVTAAVCDGHGVAGAAHWGREIAAEAASMLAEGLGFEEFQQLHEERYDETVRAAFEKRRESFREQHGFDAPGALPAEGGCTATVVNVSSDGLLTVKWVGDSRCVIKRRDGSVHALTRDHAAATHREEGLRIEKAGGAVEGAYVAAPRAGLLQVTRSLGDRAHHLMMWSWRRRRSSPCRWRTLRSRSSRRTASGPLWTIPEPPARSPTRIKVGRRRRGRGALATLARERAAASPRGVDDICRRVYSIHAFADCSR